MYKMGSIMNDRMASLILVIAIILTGLASSLHFSLIYLLDAICKKISFI